MDSNAASAHYLEAILTSKVVVVGWVGFNNKWENVHFSLRRAVELDPYNHPEYYAALSAHLALKDANKASYKVLRECLTEKIPIVSPITPVHVRPTWMQYNPLFGRMWADLADFEEEFGSEELAETYRKRAMLFLSDADSP